MAPAPAPRPSRYSYEAVAQEIQRWLIQRRGNQARAAEAVGMDSGSFRHCMNQRKGARFSLEELGRIADVADAPPGWPFIPWRDAELVRRFERLPPAARELLEHVGK